MSRAHMVLAVFCLVPMAHAPGQSTTQNQPGNPTITLPQGVSGAVTVYNDGATSPPHIFGPAGPLTPPGAANPSAIEKAVCEAIDTIPNLATLGENTGQAAIDLTQKKVLGKVEIMKRGMGSPGYTVPDGGLRIPARPWPLPIYLSDWGNFIGLQEDDFEPGGTPGGPAGHRYGKKGLAIILLHEWMHAKWNQLPWSYMVDGVYTERSGWLFDKEFAKEHVRIAEKDLARINDCLTRLAGDDLVKMGELKRFTEASLLRKRREIADLCAKLDA